ncbi:malonyl-CoA decarboxylase [Yoonia maricola]|uniref:Malonyl-CoA decarboxylase n=1 Tax=Yoonia maricola TaxID=420999 RepID=A0A2M8W4A6_9RHOB|nr:malonyl-CoA decarboxylase [Yoonia maricola]PJI85753.1 malonyl-CoA decarboxylase [Yoonia maricola]
MQRNRFLGDILSTLLDRSGVLRSTNDTRDIFALCHALLSAEGTVSGHTLAATVLDRYQSLTLDEKRAFFKFLNEELDINPTALMDLAQIYADTPTPEAFKSLSQAAEPRRQELLRRLNQPIGATAAIVAMRVDLLNIMKTAPELARTDYDFVHLLRSWFNRGFLVLKAIDWDTPARILDKIVAYEAVHQIDDWDDLRRRLYPQDRHCFAFFHPAMPDEPLIFVEVALTKTIPTKITDVLSEQRPPLAVEDAKVGVFYSISNCQKGLAGISFGNLLIKQVVAELSQMFPHLDEFVTLSPIPGLNRWLATQTDDPDHGHIATAILDQSAAPKDIRAMAARYLLTAKRDDGMPVDPVARFHLGNGAAVFDVHADADPSENGLKQSSGAMVNYHYDLSQTQRHHEDFALKSIVTAAKSAQSLSTAALSRKPKETSS